MSNSSIWPIDRTLSGATPMSQSGPVSGSNNGYSAFPKTPALLKPYHHIEDTRWESLTPLRRRSQCILQPQPNRPQDIRWGSLTPLQKCSQCILQPQPSGPQDTRWGSLTLLQRCSRCILQPQPNGPGVIFGKNIVFIKLQMSKILFSVVLFICLIYSIHFIVVI